MLDAGVIGFKCFLHPSGDETFPYVEEQDVELAYKQLAGLNALVAVRIDINSLYKNTCKSNHRISIQFHAEKRNDDTDQCAADDINNNQYDVYEYATYLNTRPARLELNAIDMILRLAQKYDR